MRIFRIESDPEIYEDEQQDGFVTVSLVDLVRHMHPYSLRVATDKKESLRDVEELQEEDVFVDVVGDDTEETPWGVAMASTPTDLSSDLIVPQLQSPAESSAVHKSTVCQEDMLKLCLPNCGEQKEKEDDTAPFAKVGSSGRRKKKVRFAPDLASIHIYHIEDEAHEGDVSGASSSADHKDDLRMAGCDSQTSALIGNSTEVAKATPPQNGNAKLKTLSLQEYRLLRQKTCLNEERKTDYRTKWPSVLETPKELPPIPFIPGYNSSQVNVQTSSSNTRSPTPGAVARCRRNLHLPLKSFPKPNLLVRKPVQAVDPPNPVTVSLQPDAKIVQPLSEEQKEIAKSQSNQTNSNPPEPVQNSDIQKQHTKCSLTISGIVKSKISAPPSSPLTVVPMQTSQESLPGVQIPVTNHASEEKRQESTGEIGNLIR